MATWLLGGKDPENREIYKDFHIFAVGFQELDDHNFGSIINDLSIRSPGHVLHHNSNQKILAKVGINKYFILVELQKKRLYIFIKECLLPYVHETQSM